jgi:hypothetical protein
MTPIAHLFSERATIPSTLNFREPSGEDIHLGVDRLCPIICVVLLHSF